MALTPRQTRTFVVAFVAGMLALVALATTLILRGQSDPEVRARVERIEAEERARTPRLRDAAVYARDSTGARSTDARSTR